VAVASAGLQVHGGMGYIEETGAAQHYRDARIAPIYEGTNGVQALDLAGRKLQATGGRAMLDLCSEMLMAARRLAAIPELETVGRRLTGGAAALVEATDWMQRNAGAASLAGATSYLQLAGDVIGGWALGRQAMLAVGFDDPWMRGKVALARLYASQVLSLAPCLGATLAEGWTELEATPAEALAA
jgi:hypothetical protein